MPFPATPSGQKLTRKRLAQLVGLPAKAVRRCTAIRLLPDGRITLRVPIDKDAWKFCVFTATTE